LHARQSREPEFCQSVRRVSERPGVHPVPRRPDGGHDRVDASSRRLHHHAEHPSSTGTHAVRHRADHAVVDLLVEVRSAGVGRGCDTVDQQKTVAEEGVQRQPTTAEMRRTRTPGSSPLDGASAWSLPAAPLQIIGLRKRTDSPLPPPATQIVTESRALQPHAQSRHSCYHHDEYNQTEPRPPDPPSRETRTGASPPLALTSLRRSSTGSPSPPPLATAR
jgi:hypothetical protein